VDHSVLSLGNSYFLAHVADLLPSNPGATMDPGAPIGVDTAVVLAHASTSDPTPESTLDLLPRAPELALTSLEQAYESANLVDAVVAPYSVLPSVVAPSAAVAGSSTPVAPTFQRVASATPGVLGSNVLPFRSSVPHVATLAPEALADDVYTLPSPASSARVPSSILPPCART
jgi:hypothetical protein